MGDTEKKEHEQKVFAAFAKRSGLAIPIASIKSGEPPQPDICCDLDGSKYFFELAEAVPQEQAHALKVKGLYSYPFPDPHERGALALTRILEKKKDKKYYTGGSPLDLLLYFDKDFALYLSDDDGDGAQPLDIEIAIKECKQSGPFRRVWSYCCWNDEAKLLA